MSVAHPNTIPEGEAAKEPAETVVDATPPRPQSLGRCAVTAALSVGLVALLRWALHPVLQEGVPYTMFLASVAIGTHRGGVRCGVGVGVLSLVVGTHLF